MFDKWPRGLLLEAPQAAPPRSDTGKMRHVLGYSCQSFRWRLSCGWLTSVLLWFGNKGMPLLWHLLMEKVTAQLRILNGHSPESILLHPTNTGRQLVTSTIQDRRRHGKCSYSTYLCSETSKDATASRRVLWIMNGNVHNRHVLLWNKELIAISQC